MFRTGSSKFAAKIHARRQADIDAARGQPKIDVRRHCLAALTAHNASRLDGADCVEPGDEVRPGPSPPAKVMVDRLVLRVRRMIVSPGRIRLPGLDQDVLCHVAGAIEDSSLDDDALAHDIRTGDIAAKIVLKDFKARLLRYEADMHIGAGRL